MIHTVEEFVEEREKAELEEDVAHHGVRFEESDDRHEKLHVEHQTIESWIIDGMEERTQKSSTGWSRSRRVQGMT